MIDLSGLSHGVWWLWVAGGFVLAMIEVVVPGFVFVGFATGAVLTGLVLLAGGPFAGWLAGSLAAAVLFFALSSLIVWVLLRRLVGVRKGQVKIWTRDINDD